MYESWIEVWGIKSLKNEYEVDSVICEEKATAMRRSAYAAVIYEVEDERVRNTQRWQVGQQSSFGNGL